MAEPMPDHQLALLGDMADTCADGWSPEDWDPDDLDAFLDLILAAVAEVDRLNAAYEPLGDKWGWCIGCDAPWDSVHRTPSCRRIPLYLRKADL